MKKLVTFGAAAALTLGVLSAAPASADPPRHSHPTYGSSDRYYSGGSYSGSRYRDDYRDDYRDRDHNRGYNRHDARDHDSRGSSGYRDGGYGTRGSRSDRYYGSNAERHNDHRAERSKWTHGGRHVIDRKHGHHR
jgi:hypothetical protein